MPIIAQLLRDEAKTQTRPSDCGSHISKHSIFRFPHKLHLAWFSATQFSKVLSLNMAETLKSKTEHLTSRSCGNGAAPEADWPQMDLIAYLAPISEKEEKEAGRLM